MAIVGNFKGTSVPSFTVGKNGVTIFQGTAAPNNSLGQSGDIYLYANSTSSSLYQKLGSSWSSLTANAVQNFGSSIDRGLPVFSGTTGKLIVDSGVTIDSNKTLSFNKNNNQIRRNQYILYGTTTDNNITELFLDNVNTRIDLPNFSTTHFQVQLVGRRTDSSGNNYSGNFQGAIVKNNTNGSTAMIAEPEETVLINPSNLPWAVSVAADTTNGTISIKVIGENTKNIFWSAVVSTIQVIYQETESYVLLDDGSFLLLEDGSYLILE